MTLGPPWVDNEVPTLDSTILERPNPSYLPFDGWDPIAPIDVDPLVRPCWGKVPNDQDQIPLVIDMVID